MIWSWRRRLSLVDLGPFGSVDCGSLRPARRPTCGVESGWGGVPAASRHRDDPARWGHRHRHRPVGRLCPVGRRRAPAMSVRLQGRPASAAPPAVLLRLRRRPRRNPHLRQPQLLRQDLRRPNGGKTRLRQQLSSSYRIRSELIHIAIEFIRFLLA